MVLQAAVECSKDFLVNVFMLRGEDGLPRLGAVSGDEIDWLVASNQQRQGSPF
jgi:hypothetical protein